MAKIGTNPSFAGLKANPSWIRKVLKEIEFKCTNTKVRMKVNIPNKIKTTTDYLTLRYESPFLLRETLTIPLEYYIQNVS